jgi:hypothetical protein
MTELGRTEHETETETETDGTRAGFTLLVTLAVAALLIVGAGVVGVSMGLRGGSHAMMWGGTVSRIDPAAPAGFELDGLPAMVVEHYHLAQANPDVYAQVPCYCGCQDMLGHRNLEDCFVTPDGAWESHAAGCQVCIDESQMVMRMMARGMGPQMMGDRVTAGFGGPMMSG